MKNVLVFSLIILLASCATTKTGINSTSWMAESINGNALATTETPIQIEIQTTEMKISGSDGCNSFTGTLTRLNDTEIEFGPMAGTRRMCPNMATSDSFNRTLGQVKKYKAKNKQLTFFDETGKELIVFQKVE